jgi:hypothetical protein
MKFSIIGSCVSRDILTAMNNDDLIGVYVARTSLASVGSKPWLDAPQITFSDKIRPWHQRMLHIDFRKTHAEHFARMKGDIVIIDLIDERGSLIEVEPGHYVTHSDILALSNFDQVSDKRKIATFSEEGFAAWTSALPRFASILLDNVPEDRIVIHHALFAGPSKPSLLANSYLDRMYGELYRLLPKALPLRASPENFEAPRDHKWGYAPFHYVDGYYQELASALLDHSMSEMSSTI